MLTKLSIGNFKAFGEIQHVPIRPLTLIFGANSSGKSSIIHSLLLANHALSNGNLDVHQPKLAGQSVDMGGFHEFVHRHEIERDCSIELAFSHPPFGGARWFGEFRSTAVILGIGKAMRNKSVDDYSGPVGVSFFTVIAGEHELLRARRNQDGSLRVEGINFDNPYFAPFLEKINMLLPLESEFEKARNSQESLNPDDSLILQEEVGLEKLRQYEESSNKCQKLKERIRANPVVESKKKLLNKMRSIPLRPGNLIPVSSRAKGAREEYAQEAELGTPWKRLDGLDSLEFLNAVSEIFCFEMEELLDWINGQFNIHLESLGYLGPLRCYPPRHLAGMHDQEPNWFSGGGHAWDILRRNETVVGKVNQWFASLQGQNTPYELRVRHLMDLGRIGDSDKTRMAERLHELRSGGDDSTAAAVNTLLAQLAKTAAGAALGEIVLFDRRTGMEVSHRDVGVGVSQVLPVLVHAFADEGQIVVIEQPEIHLHPALQAELGDVFIESALGEQQNTFIVETHSEHVILRIMKRIRETTANTLPPGKLKVKPKDVSILFVEPGPMGSVVREMPLNERGELIKCWPGGFFEESFNELF